MSFKEKSLWLLFISLLVVFGIYFASAIGAPTDNVDVRNVGMFSMMIVLLVVVQIAGAVLLAMIDRSRDRTDERDRHIGLIGARNSNYVLASGVFAALCIALVTHGNFVFVHVLLGFWVLAQLMEIGTQLFLYRRGS